MSAIIERLFVAEARKSLGRCKNGKRESQPVKGWLDLALHFYMFTLQMHESKWTEEFYVISKQECNGALYQMCLYSMGTMPGMSPRQRAGRRRTTEKAKQEINRRQRKWRLMQLINANFVSGRDLFVCLTYAPEASRARALEKFHAKIEKGVCQDWPYLQIHSGNGRT